jgi:hypothetical protein
MPLFPQSARAPALVWSWSYVMGSHGRMIRRRSSSIGGVAICDDPASAYACATACDDPTSARACPPARASPVGIYVCCDSWSGTSGNYDPPTTSVLDRVPVERHHVVI